MIEHSILSPDAALERTRSTPTYVSQDPGPEGVFRDDVVDLMRNRTRLEATTAAFLGAPLIGPNVVAHEIRNHEDERVRVQEAAIACGLLVVRHSIDIPADAGDAGFGQISQGHALSINGVYEDGIEDDGYDVEELKSGSLVWNAPMSMRFHRGLVLRPLRGANSASGAQFDKLVSYANGEVRAVGDGSRPLAIGEINDLLEIPDLDDTNSRMVGVGTRMPVLGRRSRSQEAVWAEAAMQSRRGDFEPVYGAREAIHAAIDRWREYNQSGQGTSYQSPHAA